jgi:hypothetical protein
MAINVAPRQQLQYQQRKLTPGFLVFHQVHAAFFLGMGQES